MRLHNLLVNVNYHFLLVDWCWAQGFVCMTLFVPSLSRVTWSKWWCQMTASRKRGRKAVVHTGSGGACSTLTKLYMLSLFILSIFLVRFILTIFLWWQLHISLMDTVMLTASVKQKIKRTPLTILPLVHLQALSCIQALSWTIGIKPVLEWL